MSIERRAVDLELIDDERISGRGTRRTTWLVRQGDGWTKAAEWPQAVIERRDSGPGTVWERAVRLTLPVGTEVVRVESKPRGVAPRDPLSYLRAGPGKLPLATRRTLYSVGPRGLVPKAGPAGGSHDE